MARIPSFEEALLEIHQSLGLVGYTTIQKNRFSDLGMALDSQVEMTSELLQGIFKALDLDEQACQDLMHGIMSHANFHKALELRTWTGNASQEQVLWHSLAYSFVPGIARRVAFWSLPDRGLRQPLDSGMPGGRFWFLPHWDREENLISLPVPQVIDWLLDLLGQSIGKSVESLATEKGRGNLNSETAIRTLHNWRTGTLPKSVAKIAEIFPDGMDLVFQGIYSPDFSLPENELIRSALAFIQSKGLDAEKLQCEIPMTLERLKEALGSDASAEEQLELVHLLRLRYAKPDMAIIRLRLKVARLVQDGYTRLLKSLCPGVENTCTDPQKNKLLQLIVLFEMVYNLTIAAWKNGASERDENEWFEANLHPWDAEDVLLSIVPSRFRTAYQELAHRLSQKFQSLTSEAPLEDFIPVSPEHTPAFIERKIRVIEDERLEFEKLHRLQKRIRSASPWRALQNEDNFWVISQVAGDDEMRLDIREMATQRMRELARTSGQRIAAICNELTRLQSLREKQCPKDIQAQVQRLLDEAEPHASTNEWRPVLLMQKAKHCLAQNDISGAHSAFKAAMEACSEQSCGGLRGEAALNAWGTDLIMNKLNRRNHELYYRNMLEYMEYPQGVPSFEDAATRCEEIFWTTLYQPYPGVERFEYGNSALAFKEIFGLIEKANWDGLEKWLEKNSKDFRKKSLQEARCNSVLLQWMKFDKFMRPVSNREVQVPPSISPQLLVKMAAHREHRREAIGVLLRAWPEQINLSDFKGQTPLMLAADNNDDALTNIFLNAGADVNAQDYLGRTALHSAVTGRSPKCVTLILERLPNVSTHVSNGEGNTVLHTAVRMGHPECVRLIIEEFPGLLTQENFANETPVEMARSILDNLITWQDFMHKQNRQTGSRQDFEMIAALLGADQEAPT